MQILSLELEDLRSYREASVSFVPGVNAIVGHNGAGKSTLLAAIGLALFNSKPPDTNLDQLVREGAKSSRIVVTFEAGSDGRCYEVERQLGRSSRYRVYDPEMGHKLLAEGVGDVEAWLGESLGLSAGMSLSDLFENTIGVYQGTFTAPFLLSAAPRKLIFDPLLGVDEYKRAANMLNDPLRLLRDRIQEIELRLADLAGQLRVLPEERARLGELARRIADTERDLAEKTRALGAAQERCRAFDGQRKAVSEAEQRRDHLAHDLEMTHNALRNAQEALERAERARERLMAATEGYQRYVTAESERDRLDRQRQQRDALGEAWNEAKVALAEARERAQNLRQQREELDRVARRLTELEPLAEAQRSLEAEQRTAEDAVAQLEREQRTLDDLERRLVDQRDEVARLERELAERERLGDERVSAESAIERAQAEIEQSQRELGECEAERKRLREQIDELESAEGAICPVCEGPLTPEHRAELSERNERQLRAIGERLSELREGHQQAERRRDAARQCVSGLARRIDALATSASLQRAVDVFESLAEAVRAARQSVQSLGDPNAEAERLRRELASLGNPADELAVCQIRLAERPRLEAAERDVQSTMLEREQERAQLEQRALRYADLDGRLKNVAAEMDACRDDYRNYLAHQQEAGEVTARQGRVQALCAERTERSARLEQAEQALLTAQANYDEELDQAAQEESDRLERDVAATGATLAADQMEADRTRARVLLLESLQQEQETLAEKRDKDQSIRRLIDRIKELLTQAGPYVTRQLVRGVSVEAARLYSDLMLDATVHLQWSEDYDLSLEVGGVRRGFGQLSGGEQMCAALALRLALLKKLTGIEIAFFDEPTAHLDDDRRELLATTLTHVQGFEQIFVISHDSTFEQAAQAYFQVVKDGDGSHVERL